jgi:phosphopantetheine adenylyltransferase
MTSYVIPTPTIKHVIMAYNYMEKKNIRGLDGCQLRKYVLRNYVKELSRITAIYIINNIYDGYGTAVPTLSSYDHIIHLEETIRI